MSCPGDDPVLLNKPVMGRVIWMQDEDTLKWVLCDLDNNGGVRDPRDYEDVSFFILILGLVGCSFNNDFLLSIWFFIMVIVQAHPS